MSTSEHALSETMSLIFMAMLVVVAATLLVATMTGAISHLLLKPAFFSTQVFEYDTSSSHVIGVFHQQGDAVDLNGTTQTGGSSIVSLTLVDSVGHSYPVNPDGTTLQNNQWGPGGLLYIYQSSSNVYGYTDDPTTIPPGSSLASGTYTVKILDNKVNVIINALPVTIR
jgi:hypothetical protein